MNTIRDLSRTLFQFDLSHLDDQGLYELATRVLTNGPIKNRSFEDIYDIVEDMCQSLMFNLTHLISDKDMKVLYDELVNFEKTIKKKTGSK